MKCLLMPALLAAATLSGAPSAAHAIQPPEVVPAQGRAFERRAAELVDLLTGKIGYADYFDAAFQKAVPKEKFDAITASLIAQYDLHQRSLGHRVAAVREGRRHPLARGRRRAG